MAIVRRPTPAVYLRSARRAVYKARLVAEEFGDEKTARECAEALEILERIRPQRRKVQSQAMASVAPCTYL